jgi:hypothetical protein
MTSFQGAPLTFEAAEAIKEGWLGGPTPGGARKPWSWLVAAGKNPAYDFFPCQHQARARYGVCVCVFERVCYVHFVCVCVCVCVV